MLLIYTIYITLYNKVIKLHTHRFDILDGGYLG